MNIFKEEKRNVKAKRWPPCKPPSVGVHSKKIKIVKARPRSIPAPPAPPPPASLAYNRQMTDESFFKPRCDSNPGASTVHLIHPPPSLSTTAAPPWIIFTDPDEKSNLKFHHPVTIEDKLWNLPESFDLSKFHVSTLAVSYYSNLESEQIDKILVFPPLNTANPNYDTRAFFALWNGGELRGCLPVQGGKESEWVKLSHGESVVLYDDIINFNGNIYVIDRDANLSVVTCTYSTKTLCIDKPVTTQTDTPATKWRKRLVNDGKRLYLVVRKEVELFQVYKMVWGRGKCFWEEIQGFEGGKVLFMLEDCHFFIEVGLGFVGREYENCIVFPDGAFPQYGNGCWDFSQDADKEDDDIAVFRVSDGTFAIDGENEEFPKIDWSPPAWIFDAPVTSQEKEDEEMHFNVNVEGTASLQAELPPSALAPESQPTHTVSPSLSAAAEEEVTRTLLQMNGVNDATEQGTSKKNITQLVPGACTSSTTKSNLSDFVTAKFEEFDVRSDLVPTLQKIWLKHGNIVESSTIRNRDIVARALESLATSVRILEDNSSLSLTGSQADYLTSTLSDLRCMCFKVNWLAPFVEKVVQLHKSKPLLDSLNNLSQSSSKIKERRANLLDKLAKLEEEENNLKKEMAKVSMMIPCSGQVKFDEPLGLGLT